MIGVSQVIIKDPMHAYGYALGNKVRLPNSEEYIKANPEISKWYEEDVLKGAWPTQENNEIK